MIQTIVVPIGKPNVYISDRLLTGTPNFPVKEASTKKMVENRDGEPIDILLVEDNPGDVRLTKEAFKAGSINNDFYVVTDGVEALDFLYQRGDHADAPCPNLVLLDLNLPKLDGDEVLQEMKADADLKRLPVVILTSSDAQEDILRSYEFNASAYIKKPIEPDDFIDLVQTFEEFWCTLVRLPPKPDEERGQ